MTSAAIQLIMPIMQALRESTGPTQEHRRLATKLKPFEDTLNVVHKIVLSLLLRDPTRNAAAHRTHYCDLLLQIKQSMMDGGPISEGKGG